MHSPPPPFKAKIEPHTYSQTHRLPCSMLKHSENSSVENTAKSVKINNVLNLVTAVEFFDLAGQPCTSEEMSPS